MKGSEGVTYSWQISLDSSAREVFATSPVLSNSSASSTSETLATANKCVQLTMTFSFDVTFLLNVASVLNSTVLALAVDAGSTSSTGNVVFAVGIARDPVVQWTSSSSFVELRHPYYLSAHSNPEDAVSTLPENKPLVPYVACTDAILHE